MSDYDFIKMQKKLAKYLDELLEEKGLTKAENVFQIKKS